MSNIKGTAVTQAADTQQPQPPTITLYQQIAANLHKAVTEAISQIPGYDDDLSMVGELSRRRVVPPAVIAATVSAIETNGPLTTDDEPYVDETRKGQQFGEAFKPTVGLLAGVAQRIEFMMRCYDAMAGRGALRYYHVAKRLAKNPNKSQLVTQVRLLRTLMPRRKAKQEPDAPAQKGGAIAA